MVRSSCPKNVLRSIASRVVRYTILFVPTAAEMGKEKETFTPKRGETLRGAAALAKNKCSRLHQRLGERSTRFSSAYAHYSSSGMHKLL
jgi:hypothetical protein